MTLSVQFPYTGWVPKKTLEEPSGFSETIQLRVTPEQKRLLQQAAEREDATLSAWLRHVALQQARRDTALASTPPSPMPQENPA